MVATSEPVAIYRSGAGAVPLTTWLAQQPDDPRQHLTIMARYPASGMNGAVATGLQLAREAESAGRPARVIFEEADREDISVLLAYDANPQAVARKLLGQDDANNPKEDQ